MKVLVAVLLLAAVASASSVAPVKSNQCGVQDYVLKNLANTFREAKDNIGKDGWDCLWCVGEIAQVVVDCVGLDIVNCVQDIIGSGHDCYSCVCWVVEHLGFSC